MSAYRPPRSEPSWKRRDERPSDNHLLPETAQLLAKLPHEVKITRLAVKYPRIANRIAMDWSRPNAMKAYLKSLLIDERGERHGFPAEIVAELLRLSRYYETRVYPAEEKAAAREIAWDEFR